MDVGDHTTAGDGRLDEGVELLVTTDGELKVAGGDALDLLRFGVDVTRQRLHRTLRNAEWRGSSVLEGRMRLDATPLRRIAGVEFQIWLSPFQTAVTVGRHDAG